MKKPKTSILVQLLFSWYLYIFFSTEVLSFFKLISRSFIFFADIIFLLTLYFIFRKQIVENLRKFKVKSRFSLVLIAIFSLTFIQGLFSAPNTTDAMTYHLIRTMYWIQDHTVSQSFVRNSHDFMAPFADYILMHLYLIFGSDRFSFLSQWIAFVVSVFLSGTVAIQLGASEKTKKTVMLFVALLPIALLEAASTQADMITTVITLILLHFALNFVNGQNLKNAALTGLALGLGMQIKAPFYFFAIIPLSLLLIPLFKNFKTTVIFGLLILFLASVLQLRYYSQNQYLYGNILGQKFQGQGNTYINERFDLPALTSNLIKNTMNQIPVPLFNKQAQALITGFHNLMGINIDDPKTSYFEHKFMVNPVIFPQEDIVASPLHLLLIFITGIYLFKRSVSIEIKILYLSLWIAYIIFAFILKWEPYHPRLNIPFLLIGTILSVLVLSEYKFGSNLTKFFLILSMPLGILLISLNVLRPYISYSFFYNNVKSFAKPMSDTPEAFYTEPRISQYFNSRPYYFKPYQNVTDLLAKQPRISNVVFNIREDEFEYPFWVMLKEKGVNFKGVPLNNPKAEKAPIITTSSKEFKKEGYKTKCFKTEIEYGFVCLSLSDSVR